MEQIAVDIGGLPVHVRGLTGLDELNLMEGPSAVRRLVAHLLEAGADGANPSIDDLTMAQRDRIVAALWTHTFSDTILATHHCQACSEPFDLSFSLAELVASLSTSERPAEIADLTADGRARLHTQQTVRAVTGEDEAAVASLPLSDAAVALQSRCVEGEAADEDVIDRVLDWLDPVIDTELDAVCPECSFRQQIRFSMEHYFITAMQGEKHLVLRDVHRLARAYGWSLEEILKLSRLDRRTLVAYAEGESVAANTRVWS